jgi:hypothetical protein
LLRLAREARETEGEARAKLASPQVRAEGVPAPERSVLPYVSTGADEQRGEPDRAVVTGWVNGYVIFW